MKHCINCKFQDKTVMQVGPQPNQIASVLVCRNESCSDPVSGEPIPCAHARQQPHICGWNGKYWQEKDKEPVKKEGNVIQLS